MSKKGSLTSLQKAQVEKRSRVIEYIKQHPSTTTTELIEMFEISDRSVRRYRKLAGVPAPADPRVIHNKSPEIGAIEVRYKTAYMDLRSKYETVLKMLDEKDAMLGKYIELSDAKKDIDITQINPNRREVVPVIVASDWHIEETVTAAMTNGINEYNLKIAEDSIKQFFNNAIYQVNNVDAEVNTVVLAILGDIINGVLRDEDREGNQLLPIDAMTLARSLLYSGIKMLAENTGCNIKVICCVGNHGRLTEKIHFSNQVHHSLEYLMYKTLERDFRDHPKVDFDVPESFYTIKRIFKVRVRFQHGHSFKYHGGIGGLGVPVLRKIAQMNTIEQADLDVMGHFHSTQTIGNAIINGSLVGVNGYSMALGLPRERPQQTFFLIDSEYGKTVVTPIFIDREVDKKDVEAIR